MTVHASLTPVVQVTRLGVSVAAIGAVGDARARFARSHGVHLPGFLEPSLLARIQRGLDGTKFQERVHYRLDPPPKDLALRDAGFVGRLQFLVNDVRLFDLVRRISGCGPIGCFMGSVYRMVPGAGHDDIWHDDMNGVRMLTLSVNLGTAPFCGGLLQVRERGGGRLVFEAANTGPGDAILFALSDELEHRVSRVEGDTPKTALAGWFQREPAMTTWLRRAATA